MPLFACFADFLQSDVAKTTDGVIISSTHTTHAEIGDTYVMPFPLTTKPSDNVTGIRVPFSSYTTTSGWVVSQKAKPSTDTIVIARKLLSVAIPVSVLMLQTKLSFASVLGLGFPRLEGACLLIAFLNRTASCVCWSSHYGRAARAEKLISSAR